MSEKVYVQTERILSRDQLKDLEYELKKKDENIVLLPYGVKVVKPVVIMCKDCKYYRDGDCWHEWDNDGRIYYQSVINEPNPDDYCSKAERKEE